MKYIVRKDLRDNDLRPTVSQDFYFNETIDLPLKYLFAEFEGIQPDAWDDWEYNLVIFTPDGRCFFASSIDFETKW